MTQYEYEQALKERGDEKLKENAFAYGFEATAYTDTNNSFKYGKDYKNGDYVTVIDRSLGIAVGVQIVGVTRSLTETGEVLDLIFGNQILGDSDSGGGGGGGGDDDDDYTILPYQDTYDYMSGNSQEDFGYSTLTYNQTMQILKSED